MPLVLALLLAGGLSDQAPWSEYTPSTLERIIEDHHVLTDGGDTDFVLDPGSDRHRVRVRYTGKQRTIPEGRRAFLKAWARSVQGSHTVEELFDREILVEEGSRVYWLPVQNALLPAIGREVDPDDYVELFVVFVGGRAPDWIFLVNEFAASGAHDRRSRPAPTR